MFAVLALVGCTADSGGQPIDPLDAVLRLQLDSCGSLARERATAVVSHDLRQPDTPTAAAVAVTVAHPFLDDEGLIAVEAVRAFDRRGETLDAQLVWLDPERDLALVHVSAPDGVVIDGLALRAWDPDDTVSMARFASADSPAELAPVIVERRVELTLDGVGPRMGLEIAGNVEPGDSGAPLITRTNELTGIMFAAKQVGNGGWAIDGPELGSISGERDPFELQCPAP